MTATRAWLLLIAASLTSFALVEGAVLARLVVSAVMLIAAFKVRTVIGHFMELKFQPRPWRIVFEVWTLGVTTIILGGWWITQI
jgi:Prokaryotic Cytochrome C oxidase subunit IV